MGLPGSRPKSSAGTAHSRAMRQNSRKAKNSRGQASCLSPVVCSACVPIYAGTYLRLHGDRPTCVVFRAEAGAAYAAANMDSAFLPGDDELVQSGAYCYGSFVCLKACDAGHNDRELVAIEARDFVAFANGIHKVTRDAYQNIDAGRVSKGVVDRLEAVEVYNKQRTAGLIPFRAG